MSRAQAMKVLEGVSKRAAQLGLEYHLDRGVSTRTAHQLNHYAATHGTQRQMIRRMFRAYFTESVLLSDHQVLADLAAEVGLDCASALAALEGGELADAVEADLRQAREYEISGVPFFVFAGKDAVSGGAAGGGVSAGAGHEWERDRQSSADRGRQRLMGTAARGVPPSARVPLAPPTHRYRRSPQTAALTALTAPPHSLGQVLATTLRRASPQAPLPALRTRLTTPQTSHQRPLRVGQASRLRMPFGRGNYRLAG